MIRLLLVTIALAAAMPAFAQAEDAAHRADRLRTIELNRRAQAVVDRRDRANANVRQSNREAMERYERRRAEWRKRFNACQAGDWSACQR
jgi:Ni/Co efflux regulator RcnB